MSGCILLPVDGKTRSLPCLSRDDILTRDGTRPPERSCLSLDDFSDFS